jgi:hypothetical protein
MLDATHAHLRDLARPRGVSINKLLEEVATAALSAHDAEVRFRLMAAHGKSGRALAILDRLDAADRYTGMSGAKRPFRAQRRKVAKKK